MVGLKLSSGRRISLNFFLSWILVSVICLYSLIIIERNHGGNGYPQYLVILLTAFKCSSMRWILNCSRIIALYLFTELSWDMTSLRLTEWQTLYLCTPRSECMDTSRMKEQWSPGLSAKVSIARLTISTSSDLYPPSIGNFPEWCVYSSFGPQHLCVNSSMLVF